MQPLQPLQLPCHGVRLIEASAGTGKTFTIATLYLRLLLEQKMSVRNILVVTFTEAATEELRDRIRARLRQALARLQGGESDDPLLDELLAGLDDTAAATEHLTNELTRIDEAAIFTIHGFCQRMLQENAFESGALFDVEFITDEGELLAQVVEDYWRTTFYPDPGLAALAAAKWGTPAALREQIRGYLAKRALTILPALSEAQYSRESYRQSLAAARAAWDRDAITDLLVSNKDLGRAEKAYKLDGLYPAIDALAEFLAGEPDDFALPPRFELFTTRHLDAHVTPAKQKKGIRGPEHPFFDACQRLFDAQRAKTLHLTTQAIAYCREQLALRKQRQALIAFDDLLFNLADALDGDSGPALAARIASRFPVALIDEFQDTDPDQYRIFSRIYAGRDDCGLFMIGDPKQAIYSFRGADVFTYMAAKDGTDAQRDRFTLDTNWRSATNLVDGVNALFDACHAPFVYAGHIDFHRVRAAGKADAEPLLLDGEPPVPVQAWFVERSADNVDHRGKGEPDLSKPIKKGWASEALSAACAEQIVDLLLRAGAGQARLGDRPLAPRDIAVLVRDRFEAQAVQLALRARGVASVYYSRDSVFATEEATDLLRLLAAVAEPGEDRALRAGLCTALVGTTAAGLEALLQDELAWESLLEEFHGYHRLWLEQGFMAMFRRLLHARAIPQRLLGADEGERRLTNLLQLAELTQAASREHHGLEHLLHWFAIQCAEPNGEAEEQQLRLESDEALVKIVTIHKSKGLEYPVVFLPFLWGCKPTKADRPPLFHEENSERGLVLDLDRAPEHYALAERERLAEELRLAYVALTRARHLCYFAWGQFKEAGRSALAWLLHAGTGTDSVDALAEYVVTLGDAELRARLEQIAADVPHCLAVTAPPELTERRYRPDAAVQSAPAARTPSRAVLQSWYVASFTGLTQNHFDPPERPDYGSAREDLAAAAARGPSIFQFPKGARAGSFMHKLFEEIDFANAPPEVLTHTVRTQLARHGYDAEWQGVIERMVADVLDTPLDGDTLALRRVSADRRLVELEFHYAMARLTPERLNTLLPGLGGFEADTPRLRFQPVAGVMRGFIDLVFEHEGRFYIADYKSNYLGPRPEDYAPEALGRAVAQHRYDVQYLIYTVALHRYLRHRLPDYDYERHFGGVYYLFLRGLRPSLGPDFGVWYDRPAPAQVAALDGLFTGEGGAS